MQKNNTTKDSVNPLDIVSKDIFFVNIGKKTRKTSMNNREPKPFKSGFKINTIKGVIDHPKLNCLAYIFEEDESYVECRRCIIL
jgi:hypothetical protein